MKVNDKRRQEIGLKRREKTRDKLLVAAARVCASLGEKRSSINDFITAAGVGRGTFYNYYSTREELLADLWNRVGQHPFRGIVNQMSHLDDPAERIATFMRLVARRGLSDETWGWVVYALSENETELNADLRSFPIPDLIKGWTTGRFDIEDVEVALPLVVGSIRSILLFSLQGRKTGHRVDAIAALVLRGLGVPPEEADAIAKRPLPQSGEACQPEHESSAPPGGVP